MSTYKKIIAKGHGKRHVVCYHANNKKGGLCHPTSLLYHAFNLKGVEYRSTKIVGNSIIFFVAMMVKFIKCPECSGRQNVFKGRRQGGFKWDHLGENDYFFNYNSTGLSVLNVANSGGRNLNDVSLLTN